MKDCREEWYDPERKVAVTFVDVTAAAQDLARGHLCGPTSAYFLSMALAAAAPESERASLPPVVDVTCHMCGRTCSVATGSAGKAS